MTDEEDAELKPAAPTEGTFACGSAAAEWFGGGARAEFLRMDSVAVTMTRTAELGGGEEADTACCPSDAE